MDSKLYVGGLPYSIDDQQLHDVMAPFGTVTSAKLIVDPMTSTSRGFGFVEMGTAEEAQKAIAALNGSELQGRKLTVDIARPRQGCDQGRRGGGDRGPRGY